MKPLLCLLLCLPLAAEEGGFVVLKTGQRFASQEKASDVLAKFGEWLAPRVGEATLPGRITNDPAKALSDVTDRKPLFGIVSPAFLLEHGEALGISAIAQTRRNGFAEEKYVIVVARGAKAPLRRVRTSLTAEQAYLVKVVFPKEVSAGIELVKTEWTGDDVSAIAAGDADAPAAVLLDRAETEFFKKDEQTWPLLSVAFESDDLPPDVVVAFKWTPEEKRKKLAQALLSMKDDASGKKVCETLQTDGFGPIDEKLWSRARERWAK